MLVSATSISLSLLNKAKNTQKLPTQPNSAMSKISAKKKKQLREEETRKRVTARRT